MALATIVDVARRAGTTTASVSRVLNGSGYASRAMRARVVAAAEDLGYVPHASAQLLRSSRSKLLGVVVGNLANPLAAALIDRIQRFASQSGYTTLFASANAAGPDAEADCIRTFLRQRPDGLIVATLRTAASDQLLRNVADGGVPIVLVGRALDHPRVDSISSDYRRGGEIITRHLIALGHRRIAFIGADISEAARVGRLQGYLDALKQADIRPRPSWVISDTAGAEGPRYPTYLTGYQGAQRLLRASVRPTAIVARNDITAVGAIQALKDAGMRVPDDFSVTGFDNIELASAIAPGLTTMSQATDDEAHLAAEFLVGRIERPDESVASRNISLECNLIVRASTAAPARLGQRRSGPSTSNRIH